MILINFYTAPSLQWHEPHPRNRPHGRLAEFAGISTESAVKLLKVFERDGLIKPDEKDVKFLTHQVGNFAYNLETVEINGPVLPEINKFLRCITGNRFKIVNEM